MGGAQTQFNLSWEPLKPSFQKLSPQNGFARLSPKRSGIDTLRAILISTVLAVLAWQIAQDAHRRRVGVLVDHPAGGGEPGLGATGLRLLWRSGLALLAVGAADFGVQKWRLQSSLKMSHQEVRDEAKQNETNPEVRARIRRIQRDMVRRRMLQAVPTATVIVTNPTHFAVALQYKREKNAAPIVVAKGQDLMAAKIREIARDHTVPIIENPPLARALFKECEVGDMIPGPLFGAVAEILAYLIRIKQLVL